MVRYNMLIMKQSTFTIYYIPVIILVCVTYILGKSSPFLRSRHATDDENLYRGYGKPVLRTVEKKVQEEEKLNPLTDYEIIRAKLLFGSKAAEVAKSKRDYKPKTYMRTDEQYPTGNIIRAELFRNVSGVHQPVANYMVPGHCRLSITKDHMQTAVNAFAIFINGNVQDILNLPSKYVLQSARTIAMMKIAREKLAATWEVVKNGRRADEVPFPTLEAYRPLFKYVNAREMSQLNLTDSRILKYLGTHPDLSRHQVGVIASRYIKINPDFTLPKYLNQMNNLLCGVPLLYMRNLPPNTYLQLSHQIFYHVTACDTVQRRFYLKLMTKTQALGKSYSWSARDVSRLGLLLTELTERDLSSIKPEAMAGLTAQVMLQIPAKTLKSITETQIKYIDQRSLNILSKKLKVYNDQILIDLNGTSRQYLVFSILNFFIMHLSRLLLVN